MDTAVQGSEPWYIWSVDSVSVPISIQIHLDLSRSKPRSTYRSTDNLYLRVLVRRRLLVQLQSNVLWADGFANDEEHGSGRALELQVSQLLNCS